MHLFRTITHSIVALCLGLSVISSSYAQQTSGASESVSIMPQGIELEAKLDTGAKNSSLDARNIELFEKNGDEWVRFDVVRSLNKKTITLEYPRKKNIRIIARTAAEHDAEGRPYQRRPVIDMTVCVGGTTKIIEVNLTDRSNFTFPFLLGKTAIAEFNLLVDVKKDYVLDDKCIKP